MGIMDRVRGKTKFDSVILNGVPQNQIDSLSSSPLAAPTITFSGQGTTAGTAPVYVFNILMNRNQTDDTGIEAISRRAVMTYHFEDTAGALLDGATFTLAAADNTSGLAAEGLVVPNSTVAGGIGVGKIICSSTGGVSLGVTGSSGGGTTGVLVLTLPNGQVATSSQVAFSTA